MQCIYCFEMRTCLQSTMLSSMLAVLLMTAILGPPYSAALPRSIRQAPDEDAWGPWSDEWSACSRSCGGGVSYQERKCITSRQGVEPNCVGPDVNYRSCNIQDCPEGANDFREEQCSKYNTESFQGDYYNWVPYLGAENKCELNCMPKGKHFYYRLAEKVIDGTRCDEDRLDVCVNGDCMNVGCDSMLGSNAKEDVCRECNGNGSSCKTISGVFKRRKLPFGYNDILVVPAGAVNILITEVKPSNNFLALRSASGLYYINGNFSIDFPQPFDVADTVLYYERKFGAPFYGAEVLHALGPISEPLFVVLVTQERNYGVAYNYSVPLDNQGAKPDTYSWVFGDFTSCTRTCGGGYQLRDVWCARSSDYETVPEYLCDPALKPAQNHSCNMVSCPPSWFAGDWSHCSTSCGQGQQVRVVYCEQVMHGDRADIIHDSFCETSIIQDKPDYQQDCVLAACPDWIIGDWSQCSVTCGRGIQTRPVTCGSNKILDDTNCPQDTRPEGQEECHMGPCETVQWLVSPWSDCSDQCGEGIQTRQVHCMGPSGIVYSEDVCHVDLRPDMTQRCSSRLACRPMWHASRWTECSTDCGEGLRIRNVFCAHVVNGEWETASDSLCNATIKLPTSEVCNNGPCVGSTWLTGPWTKCSANCGGGQRTRQIMCFGEGISLDGSQCDVLSVPVELESCNIQPCDEIEGGCGSSAYGCCLDGITVATGPDQEGCDSRPNEIPTTVAISTSSPTCADTPFGCCANGIDAASGPGKRGCLEEEPLETCELAQHAGPCFAYVLKWYFDITFQRCANFWYGGCEGNSNRFNTETECQSSCVIQHEPMTQEEMCSLPMGSGPCKANIQSFYYNTETGQCDSFKYGGCHGNMNKFRTPEECDIQCGTMSKDPCTLPQDRGNCFETHLRWFYDAHTQQCERFNYTGCLGNPNRFEDVVSCEEQCTVIDRVPNTPETEGIIVDVCGLPQEPGPCEAAISQWYYDPEVNACQQFLYGGCRGNGNRFDSEADCRQACVSYAAEKCSLPVESGPCRGYFPVWAYNITVGVCQPFVYGGCEGNDNRFETQEACDHDCGPKAITKCHRSRNYAAYLSQGSLGTFIPQCTLEGYFEAMQCHGSTGYCWCVDMDGREINESRRAPGFHVQRPNCEEFRPRLLSSCQRHLKQVHGKDGLSPPGQYVPQCTETGEYETIQCYGSTGYCWCVNDDGEEVDGTRRGPGMGMPSCDEIHPTVLSTCQRHLEQVHGKDGLAPPGQYVPQCTETGEYETIQCYGSTGYCWCVNDNGEEIDGTRRGPSMGMPSCDGGPQGPCPILVNQIEGGSATSVFQPVCTPDGLFVRVQCDGVSQCLCVNETTGDVLKVLNEVPQDGDFDACNEAHEDLTRCEQHRNHVLAAEEPEGHIRYVPECTEAGDYEQVQCYGDTGHCWCANDLGEEMDGTRKRPGEGVPECTVQECHAIRDEAVSSGRVGGYIPQCTEEGLYTLTQCHGGTGYCWCVDENGEELAETRRGPGLERIVCEDVCSLPKVTGPCRGYFPVFGYDKTTGTCNKFIYGGCQGNTNRFQTQQACRKACEVQGCHAIRDEAVSSGRVGGYIPQCTEEGLYTLTQCHGGTGYCWCVDENGEELAETRRGPGQERVVCEVQGCHAIRDEAVSSGRIGGYIPQCTEEGLYTLSQCHGGTGYCWCVDENGEELAETRRGPRQERVVCEVQGCHAIRDEAVSSGRVGGYIPQCTEEGLYTLTQCHGGTGYCWCVDENGEELAETRRGPGQERVVCEVQGCHAIRDEAVSSGRIGGYIPQCTEEGLYTLTQCHGGTGYCWCVDENGEELAETRRGPGQERVVCEDFQPKLTSVSPGGTPYSVSTTSSPDDRSTLVSSTSSSATSTTPSTAPPTTSSSSTESTPTVASATTLAPITTAASTTIEASTTASALPASVTESRPLPDSTADGLSSTTPETTTLSSPMCSIQRNEALASTLPGVFIPQCEQDGSFAPKQCYERIGLCWCVYEDGIEQGGTRVGMNETLDCQDECSMPEFRGQCPDNIPKWFFNAEAGVCETFVFSGCQGNMNQFDDQASCEQRCLIPVPTSCVEKQEMALASGLLGEYIPQCTEDGQYTPQQCHGSIGHCWCVDEEGMELGVTRRGPGQELLDCLDVCRLPKYSGPCKEDKTMWYYDVMDEQCQLFVYGGCQGNGNRFETEAECYRACYIPEFTGRPPTSCELQREEALNSDRLDLFVPQCTSEGAFEARQCYDLISQCWCVNEDGEAQGGTKTRDGQVPLDCSDRCSFPKFAGLCLANFPKWFYNMESMSCEEFVYGGCGGNMNQFETREDCQQTCLPQGHEMQSCHMLREEALGSNLPDVFVPECTEDGWFTSRQCHDSTGQCWCVTESGMEQGDTRREQGMRLLDCDDVCSFSKSSGPCLGYFVMWYFDNEEQACRRFIFGGCQGNGNRFESREECQQSCMVQAATTSEPRSLCVVTRGAALAQEVVGNFIPQCTEAGLFNRLQCHGSTGYCWCVDEMTGEEMVGVPLEPGVQPDCDVYYQNKMTVDIDQGNYSTPADEAALSPSHPLGDEGCVTSPFGCCPDGVTQASREDRFGCPDVTPSMVEVAPSDSTVVLGGTLTITCHAQGNPEPTVSWHRNDANVEDALDSRISVTEDGTLIIEDVIEEDSGPYVCRASNGVGQAAKVSVHVNVFTPVQIPETSQHSLRAKEGDVVELHCHATGNPKPVVTWQTGVAFLPGNDPRMTQLEDDTLRIENVDLGDAGNYVCTGRNMFGVVQMRTVTLTVEAEVQIVTLPEDTTASVGATIRLSCGSTGSPKPTTRWTVNNIGLPPMDRFDFLPAGDLIINGLRSTDAGTYTCTAANGVTSQRASATVTVTGADLDPNCQDNNNYANCRVVLRANFCHKSPYDVYCCATCKDSQVRGRRRRRR